MDMHLQFIVDQTQKYSNWLVQGMTGSTPSATPSLAPSLTPTSLLSEDGERERERKQQCVCVQYVGLATSEKISTVHLPKFQSVAIALMQVMQTFCSNF